MSLPKHMANTNDILDGVVDVVFGEIGPLPMGVDWKTAMRQRAISPRENVARHP